MNAEFANFPRLMLSFKEKTKKWRKECVMWANNKTFFNYSPVRKSVLHKLINYNLLRGKVSMKDMLLVLNPDNIQAAYIPDTILHYPIMNSKLNVLRGEESKRIFDFKFIVTNPLAISLRENTRKLELFLSLLQLVLDSSLTEDQFNQELQKLNDYYSYEWQDLREIRANALANHYMKEYNMPLMFNEGFMDVLSNSEEIYLCDIVGGEPVVHRLNPIKVRIFKNGYSNKIEDADVIIIEDYWSPGKVIDTYYDVLTPSDIKYLETVPDNVGLGSVDGMDNIDERYGFINADMVGDEVTVSDGYYFNPSNLFPDGVGTSLLPYDVAGNIRILLVYWKSKRKIKKVKSYDPETGEVLYNYYPETYIPNKDLGEEEFSMWINEAWEGTMIGDKIFVNMRPRVVQYNRISNPSRCHFGIIGSIYNLNQGRPFSLVDMMKPYNYLYDAIHDRLNKAIASNWGPLIRLDLSKVPNKWDVSKWMYYAKVNHILVEDSFKEGDYGAAAGKLAGALNNASSGGVNLDQGNYILLLVNLLDFIKMEMAEVAGISRLREGLIDNRETVGGVERSTLQSSHITEYYYFQHNDVKKRVLECLIETAKIALRGRSIKFLHILSDSSIKMVEIDGDEFAEADYGIVADNSNATQQLLQKLDTLAQAALLTLRLSFSTIIDLYSSSSISQKLRLINRDEKLIIERLQLQLQQLIESLERIALMNALLKLAELELKERANIRDNETSIIIALMSKYANEETSEDIEYSSEARANLLEKIREFDEKLKLDKLRLELDKKKVIMDGLIKREKLNKKTTNK